MRLHTVTGIVALLAIFLLLLPPGNLGQAMAEIGEETTTINSVEERRILAAIEAQKDHLREKEEILQQRELELKTLENEVDKKLVELRTTRQEAAALLERKSAAENQRLRELGGMYEKMAPEQAAALLAGVEESLAIDILSNMKSKSAGRLLGSMEPSKAAKLSKAYSSL